MTTPLLGGQNNGGSSRPWERSPGVTMPDTAQFAACNILCVTPAARLTIEARQWKLAMNVEDIASGLIRGDAPAVGRLTLEALEAGVPAEVVLNDGLIAGMNVIGTRFRNCEIYVPEVLVAARAMKAGMEHLEPVLIACGIQPVGRCLIGTVKGDIHDIGKNLVIMMLRGAGFEVVDLGVDVPSEKFMEAIRTCKPHIVGMSALLTTMMIQMERNIAAFRKSGLLEKTRVVVGGAPVTESFAREIGADAYGEDAADAKDKALELLKTLKDR